MTVREEEEQNNEGGGTEQRGRRRRTVREEEQNSKGQIQNFIKTHHTKKRKGKASHSYLN